MNYSEFFDGIDRKAYHEGEWIWKEGDLTVTRTYQYSPPGYHETCGVLFYTDDNGKLVKVGGSKAYLILNQTPGAVRIGRRKAIRQSTLEMNLKQRGAIIVKWPKR